MGDNVGEMPSRPSTSPNELQDLVGLRDSFLRLTRVKHSPLHSACDVGVWEVNRSGADVVDAARVCDLPSCRMLLRGKITLGVRCPTCQEVYHEECFFAGAWETTWDPNVYEHSPVPAQESLRTRSSTWRRRSR